MSKPSSPQLQAELAKFEKWRDEWNEIADSFTTPATVYDEAEIEAWINEGALVCRRGYKESADVRPQRPQRNDRRKGK
jgi:hypothetical protein